MPVPALAQSGRVPLAESFSKNVGAAAPGRVAYLEKIDGSPRPLITQDRGVVADLDHAHGVAETSPFREPRGR